MLENILGRLTPEAFQHNIVVTIGNGVMGVVTVCVLAFLTYHRAWKPLWRDYLTSLDPKKIGIMYFVVGTLMFLKGVTEALMMRVQQALSVGDGSGFISADHFQQVFTAHGTTMIFFVAMAFVFGFFNLIIPLQIGARDVAYPFLNSLSFYLFLAGALLVNVSLAIGEFSATGWVAYPPLSGILYSPGVGQDYWIWSVQIAGLGSLFSGINFLVTILKMRCPGMTLMKMPIFIWSAVGSLMLICFAFPILTATLAMLTLDRLMGMHFFTEDFGGNFMMYINFIWAWGHPEVYILILPAFGIFSEVVPTFSRKRLFGYTSMVWAIAAITFLSFIVWLHHFFTMGAGPYVNAFFGIMTMIIAVPTGVKIFNWLFTMCRGRVHFQTPMLWFLAFIITFTIGGMTGVLLSIPAFDFQAHNSLFLIAHFHSTIIGGVLFGFFAGITYWFPKFFGFTLNERLGKCAFWCWLFGFILAFMPLYLLGLMGATRRLDYYEASLGWQPLFVVALCGVLLILLAVTFQILQVVVSVIQRKEHLDTTGDPWEGRTLEWSTTSPPPFYNFAIIPTVHCRDPFWEKKHEPLTQPSKPHYHAIHLPKNSPMGLYIGGCCFVLGFAIIWQIFLIASIAFIGVLTFLIIRLSDDDTDYYVPVDEIEQIEAESKQRNLFT